jgi:hypothetical protein
MNLRAQLGSLFMPLLLHHYNATTAANRAAVAKEMGVATVGPAAPGSLYPGSSVTSTINHMSGGWFKGALLGTAILATGILGTLLGPHVLRKEQQTLPNSAPQSSDTCSSPTTVPPEGDYVTWQIQPDGSRKEIRRVHVRALPDGRQEQQRPDGSWVPFEGTR